MPPREAATAIVVIGLSAGGLSALRTIVQALPRPACPAVVIAHHVGPQSVLPQLAQRWTERPAGFAEDGTLLCAERIYVCPPEHHVLVKPDGTLGVVPKGRSSLGRPSIDWLLESAAASFGDRAIAILLSGSNADGARGTRFIRRAGGTVIVQDPATCAYPQMSEHALATGSVHYALAPTDMAPVLAAELRRLATSCPRGWSEPFVDELPG